MENMELMRLVAALVLAVSTAVFIERRTALRGFRPPGLRNPGRRFLATAGLAVMLLVGVFGTVVTLGERPEIDTSQLGYVELFAVNGLLLATLMLWYVLGYVGAPGVSGRWAAGGWRAQLGLRTTSVPREVGVGLVVGVAAWLGVLATMLAVAAGLYLTGNERLLEEMGKTSELIVWLAGLPVVIRLLISLSAGVCEELFFRGFLQPRIGIGASTLLFVLGHVAYGQPFMLIGITVLSLTYALLARWRGNIWAAIVAHFLFDAVQLLVLIPAALSS